MRKPGTVFSSAILSPAIFSAMSFLPVVSLLIMGAAGQTPGIAAKRGEKIAAPTFYKDVVPILQNKCQSCHRSGEAAPMPLVTYDETRPWARKMADAVEMRMMPPWFTDPRYGHFANDPSLSEEEIATIAAWAKAGAAAGDERDAPAPRRWSEGWNIPQPDFVVKMPKPVRIPERGEVEYTYEIVPTHFAEDKWVQMAEVRPSSAAHVHHAVVYIRPP
ncbi:MAG: hypothetical protein WCA20_33065, partial [Candidatus Sulfotelmatobacter sp.]